MNITNEDLKDLQKRVNKAFEKLPIPKLNTKEFRLPF
jgi:hypothetical protein